MELNNRIEELLQQGITLRESRSSDYDLLFAIYKETMEDSIVRAYGRWKQKEEVISFRRNNKSSSTRIIEINGEAIGRWMIEEKEEAIYLKNIQIIKRFQSKGIGSDLLRALIKVANDLNLDVSLQVLKSNERAVKFYTELGFKEVYDTGLRYIMRYFNSCDHKEK